MPSQKQLMEVIGIQADIAKLGLDLGQVMAVVVERTLPLIGAEGAAIELAEGEDMVYRATSGVAAPHLGLRIKRGGSLSGLCVRTGEVLRCDDTELDDRVDQAACRRVGIRSMIVIPLQHRGNTIGVLKAMAVQPGSFQRQDQVLLGLLSEAIGAAMYFAAKYDHDELFYRATHDALTDLANRSLFMDRLRNVVTRGQRDRRPAGILMIDMDGLKQINDNAGHRAGDAVLREFAQRLKKAARHSDTVARLGGDEFAVILTPVDPPHGIDAALQRLQSEIQSPFHFEGATFPLKASIGSATFPEDSEDLEVLLETADQRMYAIKRENRVLRVAHAA